MLTSGDQLSELATGRWTVLRTGAVHLVAGAERTQLIVLQIPRKLLSASTAAVGTLKARAWRARAYHDRALARTFRAFASRPHPFDAEEGQQVSTLLCRIVEHSIRKQRSHDQRRDRAWRSQYLKRLDLVQGYVLRQLRDPRLQIEDIAKHAACTTRYLHKMFAVGTDESGGHQRIGEFILTSRLEGVHAELLHGRAQEAVIKIALAYGFNNPSHFTRQYRRLFGVTPTTVRRLYRATRDRSSD